jgi:ubiquitin carboxyl-terminal hydrolase 8
MSTSEDENTEYSMPELVHALTHANRSKKGLTNMGNTCYMNSALQAFLHTWELVHYYITSSFIKDLNPNREERYLVQAWKNLTLEYWKDNKETSLEPRTLHQLIHVLAKQKNIELYGLGNQNDIHEFIGFFMDIMHEALAYQIKVTLRGNIKNSLDKYAFDGYTSWGQFYRKSYSKIIEIFYGQTMSICTCATCNSKSCTYTPEWCFTLPVPLERNKGPNQEVSIEDCWAAYTKSEIMSGSNQYNCDNCKGPRDAQKTLNIFKAPNVMIVLLKRFRTDGNGQSVKINNMVNYGTELDIRRCCSGYDKENAVYDLYSVCCHEGSVRGGHYYAYCKEPDGQWFKFNDGHASKASDSDIKSKYGYCLFYRRKL